MLTCLDFGISVLAGFLVYLLHGLQSVLSAAALLMNNRRRSSDITDA